MKRLIFTIIFFYFSYSQSIATDYYWTGGSGNWNDLNHWSTTSGGSIHPAVLPDSTDNVFFDANSFSAAGQKLSLPVDANCSKMNWSGVAHNPTFELTGTLSIYGGLILVKGMNIIRSGSWDFRSGATVNVVTTAGKYLSQVLIAGDIQLQDDLNATFVRIYSGTLNTNNVVINSFEFNLSFGSSLCTVKLGASIVNCYAWLNEGSTVLDAGTSSINTSSFKSQNHNYNNVSLNGNFPSFFVSDDVFNNLSINAANTTTISPSIGGVLQGPLTINHEFIINGPAKTIFINPSVPINLGGSLIVNSSESDIITIEGELSSPQATINKPTGISCISNTILRNLNINGPGPFYASNSIDNGNNSGWTFTNQTCENIQPTGFYWIGGSGNWNDLNHWATISGGAIHPIVLPGPGDNVHFDANSFNGMGQVVSLTDHARCRNMDWTGATFNPILEFAGSSDRLLNISGSLTLIGGMNISYPFLSGKWQFTAGYQYQSITSAGKYLPWVSFGGNLQLQDDLTAGCIYFWDGTYNTNSVSINADTINIANITEFRIYLGSSKINCNLWFYDYLGIDPSFIYPGTSIITTNSFVSQFAEYNNVILNGSSPQFEISGGMFDSIVINTTVNTTISGYSNSHIPISASISVNALLINGPARSIYFDPYIPIYLYGPFVVNSTPGDIIGIQGLYSSQQAVINSNQPVCISNVAISNINATGATFYASNSIDNGNNNGWTFTNQSCAFVLPIELKSFKSACVSGRLIFTWETVSELNSSHFNLQKQTDTGWIIIGRVHASGESHTERFYQFQSEEQDGIFRLASVDRDGKITYSVSIDVQCEYAHRIIIAPNPVRRELNLEIRSAKDEYTRLQIVNSSGVIVRNEQVKVVRGKNYFKLDLHTLPSGIYILYDPSRSIKIPFVIIQ